MIPSRMKRVEELVKEQVAIIIQKEVKDPRLEFVTVTGAKVSKDLRSAVIFIATNDNTKEHKKEVLEGLQAASGFIRRELGQHALLRYLPALKFLYDEAFEKSIHLEELFHRIHEDDRK
jgi:ribosome-binding factor A